MATKTISLELDAYERLRRARRSPRESFSSVVRRARWDGAGATGPEVLAFLEGLAPGWAATQTVPPTNLAAASAGPDAVSLTWTPITYTADGGYYEIGWSTAPGGPFTQTALTANKSTAAYPMLGLASSSPVGRRSLCILAGSVDPY